MYVIQPRFTLAEAWLNFSALRDQLSMKRCTVLPRLIFFLNNGGFLFQLILTSDCIISMSQQLAVEVGEE